MTTFIGFSCLFIVALASSPIAARHVQNKNVRESVTRKLITVNSDLNLRVSWRLCHQGREYDRLKRCSPELQLQQTTMEAG
jgi:hypothetical protein